MRERLTWPIIRRGLSYTIIVLFAVVFGGTAADDLGQRRENHDLVVAAARRSPVTTFQASAFDAIFCRLDDDAVFKAHIAEALLRDVDTDRAKLAEDLRADLVILNATISGERCAKPKAPEFAEDGTLIEPPVIPPTSTTLPIQTDSAVSSASGG